MILLIPGLADTLSLCFSGFLAYVLRTSFLFDVHPYILNLREYLFLLGIAVVLWHCLLTYNGGYDNRLLLFRIDELLLQFKTSLALLLVLMATTFIYHQYDYSRLILFFSWLFFVFFGSLGRQISHRFQESMFRRGYSRRKVLFAGANTKRPLFQIRILENPSLGIDLVVGPDDESVEQTLKREFVDDLFLFDDQATYERIWKIRSSAVNPSLSVHLIPTFGNLYLRDIRGGFFDGSIIISLDSTAYRPMYGFLKRCMDILVSMIFLFLLSPIMAAIAMLVRIDSPGPIFFRQIRVGKNGTHFTILKFRSMYDDVEAYAETPVERTDPRITRLGGLLRSTGLDELPQLWNVLWGEMSLVGPRPEMPFIVETYTELEGKRLLVKPGITGLWQIYARTSLLPIHSHVEYDLYYVENRSIFLDLMILLETIPTMVLRTGI